MISHLLRRYRALWNPDMYHGWGASRRYFEGWYFKLVDPTEQYAFAVIPGISYGIDGRNHAFIQLLDGKRCSAVYHDFETGAFQPSDQDFRLKLGSNSFSNQHIKLDLPELQGELKFRQPFPWPKTLGAPGIMGWYAFMPFMECYHGVLSMHHQIEGTLKVYDKNIDFSGGKGYMEKDWGRSFPGAWIWTQTNHFGPDERVSVMASVADIPWLGNRFTGYISGLLLEDRLFRFATYTGAKLNVTLGEHRVEISLKQKGLHLLLQARQAGGGELVAPIQGNMTGKVNESMQATVHVQLRENNILLYEGIGRNAGLEVAGKVETLLN